MKAVPFLELGDLLKLCYVSVGYVVHLLDVIHKLVAVLDYHKLVVTHQSFFLELDCGTYAQIVFDGPFVGTAEHDRFIFTVFGIGIGDLLDQLSSAYSLNIIERSCFQSQIAYIHNSRTALQLGYHLPYARGVVQNARLALLTDNSSKFRKDGSSHHSHILTQERRAGIQTHRRKLSRVSYQNDLTSGSVPDKRNEVFKKIARSECCRRLLLPCINADQRDLIDHKERVLVLVRSKRELAEAVASDRFLSVYMFMNCICRLRRVRRKDLRGSSGRRQQDAFYLIFL